MADADGRPLASHENASSSPSPSHIHQVIDEAMMYLNPPPHESLTVDSVAHAYTILQQEAAASSSSSHHVHPRLEQMASILHPNHTVVVKNNSNDDWMLEQTDLYRALLLSSFLLLELGSDYDCYDYSAAAGGDDDDDDDDDDENTKMVLQSSVERCLLLLKILANDNNDYDSLPPSRHALLQAVLEEPLIPLHKQERQYSYILQRNKHDHDNDENDTNSIEDEENNIVRTMDQRQLVREEQELWKLARRLIPKNHGGGDDASSSPPDKTPSTSIVVQEGPLVWIHNDNTQTPCHVQLYTCGMIRIQTTTTTSVQEGTPTTKDNVFHLTNTTTCEPRVDSQSFTILLRNCHSPREQQQQQPTPMESFQFQADSLIVGYAWITFINKVICQLKKSASLQKELWLEWKDEYDDAKKKAISGAGSLIYNQSGDELLDLRSGAELHI